MLANITTESYPVEFYPAKSSLKRNTCVLKKFQFFAGESCGTRFYEDFKNHNKNLLQVEYHHKIFDQNLIHGIN